MKLKRHSNFLNETITQKDFNNPTVDKGERVEMIKMADDPAPIEPGEKGTVNHVDGIGQIHVDWDNGRTLAIIPEEDRFKLISESKSNKEESSHSEYQTYFKSKLEEFEVKSPKELTKKQWNDIEAHWHSKYGTDYSKYFKAKLKEFKVDNMSTLTKAQWNSINNGWVSKDEMNESRRDNYNNIISKLKGQKVGNWAFYYDAHPGDWTWINGNTEVIVNPSENEDGKVISGIDTENPKDSKLLIADVGLPNWDNATNANDFIAKYLGAVKAILNKYS